MQFSRLQKYILKECYARNGKKIDRKIFVEFYVKNSRVKKDLRTKIITNSIERLIDRDLLVGYGLRFSKRWYITDVKITAIGKKQWEKFLNRKQKKLPI